VVPALKPLLERIMRLSKKKMEPLLNKSVPILKGLKIKHLKHFF